jgi:hypothetical protein
MTSEALEGPGGCGDGDEAGGGDGGWGEPGATGLSVHAAAAIASDHAARAARFRALAIGPPCRPAGDTRLPPDTKPILFVPASPSSVLGGLFRVFDSSTGTP